MFWNHSRKLRDALATNDRLSAALTAERTARIEEREATQRQAAAQAQKVIDDLTEDYYRAVAAIEQGGARPFIDGRIGVLHHVQDVLSRLTGISTITISFRLDHGIPPGPNGNGYMAHNIAPSDCLPEYRLRKPDGTDVDLAEHVRSLIERHKTPGASTPPTELAVSR